MKNRKWYYPLISSRDNPPIQPATEAKPKGVRLETAPFLQDPDALAELAIARAKGEGCVLLLRNTVRNAVATLRALERRLGAESNLLFRVEGVVAPHHARFAAEDRRLLDKTVTDIFGKQAPEQPGTRRPCILVSTQTLEQSLDVDFDLLITDLCPADVLLQRIGRLHRHDNQRPPWLKEPTCIVITPKDDDLNFLVSKEARAYGYGEERAYEDARTLAATWRLALEWERRGRLLSIPAENRFWVERSTHPEALRAIEEEMGDAWRNKAAQLFGKHGAETQMANQCAIHWRKPFGPDSAGLKDDSRAVTRLGLDDLALELPERLPELMPDPLAGPFGQTVRLLRIPGHMLLGCNIPEEPAPEYLRPIPGGFVFGIAGRRFRYDRFGIEQEDHA